MVPVKRKEAASDGQEGIGVPPMVQLGAALKAQGCTGVQTVAGYRDELLLTEELSASGDFYICNGRWKCRNEGKCHGCCP